MRQSLALSDLQNTEEESKDYRYLTFSLALSFREPAAAKATATRILLLGECPIFAAFFAA
jgi:hypothetical protein